MTSLHQSFPIPKIIWLLCLVAMVGCSGNKELTGNITCKSEPIAKGRITFQPTTGREVYGQIEDGKIINVTTEVPGDGLPVGKYGVSIYAFIRQPVGMEEVPSLIDKKYNTVATSGLNLEITSSGPNEFEVDLDPASEK